MQHEVTSITDAYWVCIHATNEIDPEKIDHSLVDQDGLVEGKLGLDRKAAAAGGRVSGAALNAAIVKEA